jgi:hypothetical protein
VGRLAFIHAFEVTVNLFSTNFMFTSPSVSPPAAYIIVPIVFGILFLASAICYWRRGKLAPDNPVARRFIRRVSKAGMWTSAIGLVLAAARYAQFDYLDMPIWMYLLVLAMIITAAYYVYDRSERYPLAMWRLQEADAQRRYRPAAARPREPQRIGARNRPDRMRGKRKR